MIDWKECGRKRPWSNVRYWSRHLPRGTEEDHEMLQSVSWLRIELDTFQIQVKSVKAWVNSHGLMVNVPQVLFWRMRQSLVLRKCIRIQWTADEEPSFRIWSQGSRYKAYVRLIRIVLLTRIDPYLTLSSWYTSPTSILSNVPLHSYGHFVHTITCVRCGALGTLRRTERAGGDTTADRAGTVWGTAIPCPVYS
jgi:hypothetical protein